MVVSVTDIFMRQIKLMELLSSLGPNAEFEQKAHGSHLNLPFTSADRKANTGGLAKN